MFSGHENLTVEELRHEIGAWAGTALSMEEAISGLIGAIKILCNRIGELEHRLEWQGNYRRFENGVELVKALGDLHDLKVGTYLIYHGILHEVIDCGEQGRRVEAVKVQGIYQDKEPVLVIRPPTER